MLIMMINFKEMYSFYFNYNNNDGSLKLPYTFS